MPVHPTKRLARQNTEETGDDPADEGGNKPKKGARGNKNPRKRKTAETPTPKPKHSAKLRRLSATQIGRTSIVQNRPSQDAKLAREIDTSERVSLGVTHFFKKVEEDVAWASVSEKVFSGHMKKLTDRLSPDLNVLYTQGYDGQTPTAGRSLKLHASLRCWLSRA